jgi:hypothetical protein
VSYSADERNPTRPPLPSWEGLGEGEKGAAMNPLNHHRFIAAIFAAALCFIFLGCAAQRENRLLEGPMPAGFEQISPVAVYNKTTLFDFMDGEAEVYFPLGFRLLYIHVYRSDETDARMSVEVYDMRAENGSREVYRHYSGEGGSTLMGIGETAWTDQWLLLFTRGPYFVRISPDPSMESKVKPALQDMIALARQIDEVLK